MSETHEEQIERVERMASGHYSVFELSPYDIEAIRTVLRERAELLKWLKIYADNPTGHPGARIAIGEAEGKRMRVELAIERKSREHSWQFYANGTFCTRCGLAIGSGVPCAK